MNEKTIPILKRGPGFEEPSGTSSLKIVKSLPPLIPQLRKRPRINLLLRQEADYDNHFYVLTIPILNQILFYSFLQGIPGTPGRNGKF